jgi:hypothetical protein
VIAFTVLLSVLAHGLTADPLAHRYGPRLATTADGPDDTGMQQLPARRLIRRAPLPSRAPPSDSMRRRSSACTADCADDTRSCNACASCSISDVPFGLAELPSSRYGRAARSPTGRFSLVTSKITLPGPTRSVRHLVAVAARSLPTVRSLAGIAGVRMPVPPAGTRSSCGCQEPPRDISRATAGTCPALRVVPACQWFDLDATALRAGDGQVGVDDEDPTSDGYCGSSETVQARSPGRPSATTTPTREDQLWPLEPGKAQVRLGRWGGWGSNPRPADYESAALTS